MADTRRTRVRGRRSFALALTLALTLASGPVPVPVPATGAGAGTDPPGGGGGAARHGGNVAADELAPPLVEMEEAVAWVQQPVEHRVPCAPASFSCSLVSLLSLLLSSPLLSLLLSLGDCRLSGGRGSRCT